MKKIAMISYHTCPLSYEEGKETGGMNVYVFELSKKLAAMGYMVDVYTRAQDEISPKIVEVHENFRVIHLVSGPQKSVSRKDLSQYIPEFVENFLDFCHKENLSYDMFHCHYFLSGLIGLSLNDKLSRRIPISMTFHTLALMKNLVARSDEEKESFQRIDAEKLLVQKADCIISPSRADALSLQYLYGCERSKITIIPPGVDTHTYTPSDKEIAKEHIGLSKNQKLIVFVGRIEPLKGIDTLLYALKILKTKCPHLPINLFIIGGDMSQQKELWSDELKKLEVLRSTLDLTTAVSFVGRKKPEELPTYYNSADVVVMPSYYESFGMTALEAMACGTPVITTDVAGIVDITNEKHKNLLITTSNNPLLLATKIRTILQSPTLAKRISKELVTTIQIYDWRYIAEKISQAYERVMYL